MRRASVVLSGNIVVVARRGYEWNIVERRFYCTLYVKVADTLVEECVDSNLVGGVYNACGIASAFERVVGHVDEGKFFGVGPEEFESGVVLQA